MICKFLVNHSKLPHSFFAFYQLDKEIDHAKASRSLRPEAPEVQCRREEMTSWFELLDHTLLTSIADS